MPMQPSSVAHYMTGFDAISLRPWGCRLYGFSEILPGTVRRLEVAQPRVKLIIGLSSPYGLAAGARNDRCQAFVVSRPAGPVIVEQSGAHSCIEVELPPWAAYRLFQGDEQVLASPWLDLRELWGPSIALLVEALDEIPCWTSRLLRVEAFLAERMQRSRREVPEMLRRAWEALQHSAGGIPIRHLSEQAGYSGRHFASRFKAYLGQGPKACARHIRFARAQQLLESAPALELVQVALLCGYSDQSHLNRDFQVFIGCSPAAYARAGWADIPGKPASLLDTQDVSAPRSVLFKTR
ncbi:helix-turn-helix domain-containing protein [Pseudomonas sp. Fl5BN2]|uniref:AraC family transcriptional regulator n=1 Tax=unclassified Pseudomonas TaxID=196821 RepID=UPI001378829A|nr:MULTISPECIES: helix-turn-helix domain-containing protein [unclassified Pseudomonas]NBF03909.1 helix-turn-helix domain-containing protein [Pseudomonas sp. Fl5BN2]NBF13343.1 helix-turn-helix domain-containing protein [Pseudomonas sp. Fl4BN1]